MTQTNKTYNHAMLYGIGTMLKHMASIIMLPIYTRYLTPADYGMAELLSMGVEIIGLIVGVIGGDALIRFYYENDNAFYRKQVAFTATSISVAMNITAFFFIVLTATSYSDFIFKGTQVQNGETLIVLYAASLIFQVMSAMPGAYIRAQQKPLLFVLFSVLRLILAISANLYFVVYRELHIEGVVYAVFTFTLLDGLIQTGYMLYNTGFKFSFPLARKMVHFSLPLLLSSLALFLATYADRIILKEYISLTALGLYALAYKFAFMLASLAWGPIQQAWDVKRYEVVKMANATEVFQSTFRQTQLFVIFIALIFVVLSKDILRIMSAEAFHSAYQIVAILIPAYVIKIWSNFCFFGVFYAKKTKYKAYIEWFSSFLSLGLFFLLIPFFSVFGAATATLIAFSIRFVLINHYSTKCYDMKLQWGFIAKLMAIAILLSVLSLNIDLPLLSSLFFNLGIICSFIFITYVLPILPNEDKAALTTMLRLPLKIIKANRG